MEKLSYNEVKNLKIGDVVFYRHWSYNEDLNIAFVGKIKDEVVRKHFDTEVYYFLLTDAIKIGGILELDKNNYTINKFIEPNEEVYYLGKGKVSDYPEFIV